ncbi:MAG: TerB N-terminal domain-containing protein [Eubacteriales bacterium]|nr:hypothetical protein [Clostridiales bacterium]
MDEKDRRPNRDSEFWDIEFTRPKRKLRRFAHDTGTTLLHISNDESCPAESEGKVPRPPADRESMRFRRGSPKPQKDSAGRKPTLEELMRDGLIVHASDIEPFPQTAAERLEEKDVRSAGAEGNSSHDEPQVTQPPGISPWESYDTGEKIPRRANMMQNSEPYLCYTPDDNKLISEVRVSNWPSPYTFYERFRSDARRYLDFPAQECPPAPFFSFMPQYVQLSADQLAWYFYWRSLVREGKYPATDFGYVMLYIYELINLTDMLEPEQVLQQLCDVWLGYRDRHPRLDRYLAEWVCDLCLIHRLPLPYERLAPIYPQIISASRFKEFYVGCTKGSDLPLAEALLNFNSGYDWRRSKYLADENRHLFEEHIIGAFLYACRKLESAEPAVEYTQSPETNLICSALRTYGTRQRVIRDAYSGALCAYEIKRKIEVHYYSCTRSPELRYIVTDMVKYAENNVRAMIGVKSRLGTPNLPAAAKALIAEYFAPLREKRKKKAEKAPEYERFYEAESKGLSPEAALELERRSWETTRLLVDAFDDHSTEFDGKSAPGGVTHAAVDTLGTANSADLATAENETDTGKDSPVSGTIQPTGERDVSLHEGAGDRPEFERYRRAYVFLRDGNTQSFSALAESMNLMPETLVEKLNEYAYDIIGDIAAEPGGPGGWQIVDDYVAELDEHFGCAP